MGMDDILFGPEIWGTDTIHSDIWTVLPDTTTGNAHTHLQMYQTHDTYDYLRMIAKLLPFGSPWRHPLGDPSDYGC